MRVKPKVNVRIYDDAAGKDVLFAPDDAAAERVLDGMTEQSSGKIVLTQDNTPFTLPVGTVDDAKGLYVRCSTDFLLTIDGGAPLSVEKPRKATGVDADYATIYLDVAFTNADIALDSAIEEASIMFALWGDEIA